MIRINLLPQEERARRRQLPTIKIPRIGAFVPFVVLGGLVLVVGSISTMQGREVTKLREEITNVRAESESYKPQLEKIRQITQTRQEIRNRLDIIARLDRQRYFRVQLLDELNKSVPQNMWISALNEQSERSYQVDGVTFSNINVAAFMRNLESKEHWANVDLGVAQQGRIDDLDVVRFTLTLGAMP